jgi:hypothetical protein
VEGEKGRFGKAEMLNAERATANSKATGEAANRMGGVKTEALKWRVESSDFEAFSFGNMRSFPNRFGKN